MDDLAARDRVQKLDLLELRKQLDARKHWQAEVKLQQCILDDPRRIKQHHTAKRLQRLATRALALTDAQIALVMEILNAEDDKEEIERQLAALDD